MKHYITFYGKNGKCYAESWIQINLFGKVICFSKKIEEITREDFDFVTGHC